MTRPQTLALCSIAIGILVLSIKLLAYWVTGSIALLSDALESVVNVAAAGVAFLAIRWAAQPADDNHPYGHQKAEMMSAILEGALILVAALFIFQAAFDAWQSPRALSDVNLGLALNVFATLMNAGWARVLITQGQRHKSQALIADGIHLKTDVISSLGILIGLSLATLAGLPWLDPLLGAVVGCVILYSGFRLVLASVPELMDQAVPEELQTEIKEIITDAGQGAVQAHDLRSRHAGRLTFVEFHLVVPGHMTVWESHALCDKIERKLSERIPNLRPHIHVEPEHKAEDNAIPIQDP